MNGLRELEGEVEVNVELLSACLSMGRSLSVAVLVLGFVFDMVDCADVGPYSAPCLLVDGTV